MDHGELKTMFLYNCSKQCCHMNIRFLYLHYILDIFCSYTNTNYNDQPWSLQPWSLLYKSWFDFWRWKKWSWQVVNTALNFKWWHEITMTYLSRSSKWSHLEITVVHCHVLQEAIWMRRKCLQWFRGSFYKLQIKVPIRETHHTVYHYTFLLASNHTLHT
jgi:hypothetical protein